MSSLHLHPSASFVLLPSRAVPTLLYVYTEKILALTRNETDYANIEIYGGLWSLINGPEVYSSTECESHY